MAYADFSQDQIKSNFRDFPEKFVLQIIFTDQCVITAVCIS